MLPDKGIAVNRAQSWAMQTTRPSIVSEHVLRRVCGEYLEMPGLRLTRRQAQRLWGLDERACAEILEFLVSVKFLRRTESDSYARASDGATNLPEFTCP